MPVMTDEGRRVVDQLAQRHGFSHDATEQMLIAVLNGNGQMAQFSHPEFGGSGQWMRGGMTMIGDMFNNYLKGRVDGLCEDIASHLQHYGSVMQSGSFQSQTQSGAGSQNQESGSLRTESKLFAPDPSQNWWPQDLGRPSATGSQNNTQYAYFPAARRLAVKTGNSIWVYNTLDHQIGGFSQQQGSSGNITFSSQFGTIDLSALPVVMRDGQAVVDLPPATVAPPAAEAVPMSAAVASSNSATSSSNPVAQASYPIAPAPTASASSNSDSAALTAVDIFALIEKLGVLKEKGLLTDEEFNDKKKELLARL